MTTLIQIKYACATQSCPYYRRLVGLFAGPCRGCGANRIIGVINTIARGRS